MSLPATAPRAPRRAIAVDEARHDGRRQSRAARQLAQRNAEGRAGHRRLRTGLWPYVWRGELATLLTAPVIYSVAVPFVVLDAWVWTYQAVCFRAWGIRPVRRRAYLAIDRHELAYLNAFEKFNCLFCSYANGLIAMSAKSPRERNSIGVRFATPGARDGRTSTTTHSWSTAPPPPTGASCRS